MNMKIYLVEDSLNTWFKYLAKNLNKYSYILGNKNTNYKELILYAEYKKKNYYAVI